MNNNQGHVVATSMYLVVCIFMYMSIDGDGLIKFEEYRYPHSHLQHVITTNPSSQAHDDWASQSL